MLQDAPDHAARHVPVHDVSYMDDETIFITAATSRELVPRGQTALSVIQSVFSKWRLKLNFSKGKSDSVLAFAGLGSRTQRQKWKTAHTEGIPFDTSDGVSKVLAVHTHKNLGRMYSASGSLRPETKHRAGQVWQSLSKAEIQFYRSGQTSPKKRMAVLRVLILSRVLHNAGTWPRLTKEEIG